MFILNGQTKQKAGRGGLEISVQLEKQLESKSTSFTRTQNHHKVNRRQLPRLSDLVLAVASPGTSLSCCTSSSRCCPNARRHFPAHHPPAASRTHEPRHTFQHAPFHSFSSSFAQYLLFSSYICFLNPSQNLPRAPQVSSPSAKAWGCALAEPENIHPAHQAYLKKVPGCSPSIHIHF